MVLTLSIFEGIENPIGVKVGPTMEPDELVELIQKLEPENRSGRITLISRQGARWRSRQIAPFNSGGEKSGISGGLVVRSHAWKYDAHQQRFKNPEL